MYVHMCSAGLRCGLYRRLFHPRHIWTDLPFFTLNIDVSASYTYTYTSFMKGIGCSKQHRGKILPSLV